MHRIMRHAGEEDLYMKYVGCPRLDHACSHYVRGLINFFNVLWQYRMERAGFRIESHISNVHWDTDDEDGFRGEHKGRLASPYMVKHQKKTAGLHTSDEFPVDDHDHPTCLCVNGSHHISIDLPLAGTITKPDGTMCTKWFSLDRVLGDADDQFRAVMDRIVTMSQTAEANNFVLTASAHAFNYSHRIVVRVNVDYEGHIYDTRSEESCPYYSRQPAGDIEEGEEELHEDSATGLTW